MDNNNLPTIHQNSKLILAKSKSLLDTTQKILAKKTIKLLVFVHGLPQRRVKA